ncbi:response regulator transcription factor [Streptococcus jiangjianxini]|uniref:response regulator transcription factor n=1 Tax=Streptococcus jiangjianxini TaxID=3161189 RepID=UPI0032EC35CE
MYKLLIVEDEHLIRKWLRYALDYESLGIIVVGEAKDGQEGVKQIHQLKPDIVLTDINMPIMSAFEMFEATRDLTYEKIILSGYADFSNAREALHYGAVEFLTKPLDKEALFSCLKKIMSQLREREKVTSQTISQSYVDLPVLTDNMPEAVELVVAWIHQHYQEKITIAQMAHDIGYSESYLYNMIKKYLQTTINDYINQYRISLAIQLLMDQPDKLVYQLGEEVGYNDYRYFDRVFKKYVGMTVNQFKKRHTV